MNFALAALSGGVKECADADAVFALIGPASIARLDVSQAVFIAAADRESVEVFPTPLRHPTGADRVGLRKLAGGGSAVRRNLANQPRRRRARRSLFGRGP